MPVCTSTKYPAGSPLLACALLVAFTSSALGDAVPAHHGTGSSCGWPYALPQLDGSLVSSEGSGSPTFELNEEFVDFKFDFPLEKGETVMASTKLLDPSKDNKVVGSAYWTGIALGTDPYKTLVNWQVTFVLTEGIGKYQNYGPGSLTAVGTGVNDGALVTLQIVGGSGSFCKVSGGLFVYKQLSTTPGAHGANKFYLKFDRK